MPDAYEVASNVEAVLESGTAKSDDALREVASAYAALCHEANTRLKRCADFLRRGLRSEAIYHAELEPDLLDLVGVLDLVPAEEWRAVCADKNLEPPPALLVDVAKELSESYTAEAAADRYMRKLRLLSLSRAPVRERLEVLRALAEVGPVSPQQQQDTESFEEARLREIASEAKQAYQSEDQAHLSRLIRELSESNWRVPVPAELPSSAARLGRQLQVRRAVEKLKVLLPELHDAYVALSYEEGKPLLDRWNEIVAANQLTVPEDLQSQVQPIVDWIDELDRERQLEIDFANACAHLEQALDDETSPAALQRAYQHAISFDRAVPGELVNRYRLRLAELELQHKRRTRLVLALSAVGVLAAGAVVALLIHRSIIHGEIESWRSQIVAAIGKPDLKEAERLWGQLERTRPDLAAAPALQELRKRLDEEIALKREKDELFRQNMDMAICTCMGRLILTWPREPDERDIEPAGKSVREARPYVDDPKENLEFIAWEDLVKDIEIGIQDQRDKAFLAMVKELAKHFASVKIGEMDANNVHEKERAVAGLRARLNELHARSDKVSSGYVELLPAYRARLNSWDRAIKDLKRVIEEHQQEWADIVALRDHAGSADELKKALEAFVRKYPGSAKNDDFKRAAQMSGGWAAVLKWGELVRGWNGKLRPTTSADVAKRLEAAQGYLTGHPATPFKGSLKTYLEYLAKAQSAMADENPWKASLTVIMDTPIMRLYSFKATGGKVYYTTKDPKITEGSLGCSIPVALTPDTTKLTKKQFKSRQEITEPKSSPQFKLADNILALLRRYDTSAWESFGFELATLIRDSKDVDAVLRAMLLEEALKATQSACWGADEQIRRLIEDLKLSGEAINWMNPDDERAAAARKDMEAYLSKLKPYSEIARDCALKRDELFQKLLIGSSGVTRVALQEGGRWQVLLAAQDSIKDGATAWIVKPPAGGAMSLEKIGEVKDGNVVVSDQAMVGMPEGIMVFIHDPGPKQ